MTPGLLGGERIRSDAAHLEVGREHLVCCFLHEFNNTRFAQPYLLRQLEVLSR